MNDSGLKPAETVQTTGEVKLAIAVGLVCGLLAVVQSIGFGTLLFSGAPRSLAAAGMGMGLLSTAIMGLIPLFSSHRGIIASAQSVPTAAMAGIVTAMVAGMPTPQEPVILATVVATVALTTVFIGASTSLLGIFGLSRFIRFIPHPVVGGFLAGSGWLVLVGGIDAIAGEHFASDPLRFLSDPATLVRGATAAVLIAIVALLRQLTTWRLVLPAVMAAALVLFNAVVFAGPVSGNTLLATHWLLELPGGGMLWPPMAPADLALVDWSAVGKQLPSLLTVPVLAVIAMLMNATSIELDARQDLDLDRELRTTGLANLIAGAGGGLVGYHSLSLTTLASRLGGGQIVAGLTVSAICVLALFFGGTVVSLVPTPVIGGMLIWVGGGLVHQWLVQSHARLATAEYGVVVLIFAIIAFVGFVEGILVGLIAAAVLFAIEYGRVDIIRYTLTGRDYQTQTDTSEARLEVLQNQGDAILLFRLQGFLFFGTADRLRRSIQFRIVEQTERPVRFLVIDFHRVSGLDSSAVLSFVRLSQLAQPGGFTLVLTGMSDQVKEAMQRGGLTQQDGTIRFAKNFDQGVEWCENALIADVAPELSVAQVRPAEEILREVIGDPVYTEKLLPFFDRVKIDKGDALIVQGKPSDDIFIIEQGRASVELMNGAQTVRLATVTHGAIVGEIAFYRAVPRSASVIAETDLVAWRFSRASLERLRASDPDVAARFHQGIAAMLADRLTSTNRLIQLLAD